MNKLDPFEKLINQKLQDHTVEFSYDSWDAMEHKLPKANYNTTILTTLGVIVLATSTFFIFKHNPPTDTLSSSSPSIKNETPSLQSIENNIEFVSEKNNELNSAKQVEEPGVFNKNESTSLNEAIELSKIIVSEKDSELLNSEIKTNKTLITNTEKVKLQDLVKKNQILNK